MNRELSVFLGARGMVGSARLLLAILFVAALVVEHFLLVRGIRAWKSRGGAVRRPVIDYLITAGFAQAPAGSFAPPECYHSESAASSASIDFPGGAGWLQPAKVPGGFRLDRSIFPPPSGSIWLPSFAGLPIGETPGRALRFRASHECG